MLVHVPGRPRTTTTMAGRSPRITHRPGCTMRRPKQYHDGAVARETRWSAFFHGLILRRVLLLCRLRHYARHRDLRGHHHCRLNHARACPAQPVIHVHERDRADVAGQERVRWLVRHRYPREPRARGSIGQPSKNARGKRHVMREGLGGRRIVQNAERLRHVGADARQAQLCRVADQVHVCGECAGAQLL